MTRRRKRQYARARLKPKKKGEPNQLELRHKAEVIDTNPDLVVIGYECWTFDLAPTLPTPTTYTPDWVVQRISDGEIELHECKGGQWLGDSRVKFKVAADKYPMFHWKSYLYSGRTLKKEEVL